MSRAKMFMAAIVGVLALSGLTSSMASAVTAGWMVNGTMLTQDTAALANTALVDEEGELVAGSQIKINCQGTELDGTNPRINSLNNMAEVDSLRFLGCKGNAVCPLAGSQEEKINTLPLLIDLTLNGALAVKGVFLPTNTSKLFSTIKFEGPECSFSGVNGVTGTEGFLAPTGQDERTLQLLTAETFLGGELKLAGLEAKIKGSILIRMANGQAFSFL